MLFREGNDEIDDTRSHRSHFRHCFLTTGHPWKVDRKMRDLFRGNRSERTTFRLLKTRKFNHKDTKTQRIRGQFSKRPC